MDRKKKWITAGVLAISLACTARGETIDMGGFRIQVGQRQDGETGLPEPSGTQQESVQASRQKPAVETPESQKEDSVSMPTEYPYREPQAEAAQQAAEASEEPVQNEWEGQTHWEPEEPGQVYQWPEDGPAERGAPEDSAAWQQEGSTQASEEAEMPEADASEDGSAGQAQTETGAEKQAEGREGEKGERGRVGEGQKISEKKAVQQEVQFIHSDSIRLEPGILPSVRLGGQEEICVVSYAVNHQECACKWEGDRLVPVDPPLRKGLNCLEVSVFSGNGRVISMEPWYFSCGVGAAVL